MTATAKPSPFKPRNTRGTLRRLYAYARPY